MPHVKILAAIFISFSLCTINSSAQTEEPAELVEAAESVEPADAQPSDEEWSSMESNYFIIYYRPTANLRQIERYITKRPLYLDQKARYGETTVSDEICYRLDKLFNRVKEVLNMYPKIPKVNIRIFRDRVELNDEYYRLLGKITDFRSFYINKHNTIYTSEVDMEDSVMIHEMAHVVIDHYFAVIPPEKVSEILASYVDSHLE